MKVGTFSKQPGERLSNSILYTEALDEGDSIVSVLSCVAEPSGLTVSPVMVSGDRVRVWAEGGVSGVAYKITVTVATNGGEILEDELICKVKEL